MTGVQLIGKGQVLERFETFQASTHADAWGLFQGKEFIAGGIGADNLDGWLTSFEATGSTATYKLRIYDAEQPPTSSTANSDYLACFTFKVIDQYEGAGIAGHNSKLMERIGALEKQLKEREEDPDENEDIGSIVMGWLSDPVKLTQVAGAVRTMLGTGSSVGGHVEQPPTALPLQTVSGVNPQPDNQDAMLDELSGALDTLGRKDKDLVKHLKKLAELAEKKPELFKILITNLDTL